MRHDARITRSGDALGRRSRLHGSLPRRRQAELLPLARVCRGKALVLTVEIIYTCRFRWFATLPQLRKIVC